MTSPVAFKQRTVSARAQAMEAVQQLQSQRVFRTLKCRCSAARPIIALEAQGFDTRRYDSRKKAGCVHAALGAEPILQFIWGSK
jgi:hypothetical protein